MQALSVINAAAEILPPDDGQLHSALRRHSTAWKVPEKTPQPPQSADGLSASEPAGPNAPEDSAPTGREEGAVGPAQETTTSAEAPLGDSEFDRPWTE